MDNQAAVIREKVGVSVAREDRLMGLGKRPRLSESLIQGFLFLCGFITIFTTIAIVVVLGRESMLLLRSEYVDQSGVHTIDIIDFFNTTQWQPHRYQVGIAPLVTATLLSSGIAMLVALPMGLGSAIYLSEYASARVRNTLKPILEVLAGVPTVVYGFFALQFMTPVLKGIFGGGTVETFNIMSAGLVMGIMILPLVASMSEDALSSVPRALREASFGLGSTKLETTIRVVVPAGISGIIAAFIIAISRAIGETMIMAIAAGARPNLSLNPFESAWTMTGYIASISGGDLGYDTLDYNSIFIVGLFLFLMTLGLNILSRAVVARFREVYE
ncbi:MAG TPA: phosphate ABC transporter permease subunit PstC [Aggregatilinea sp.]|jgi:phosphate transport system permease protein|uniref:phosphate ABC transporter permease subunit PstC n=1 Tax=Aggregatilinea sp. TaxID=2806333 RepID=UPI002C446FF6|nr:phosphate ABC transporter permease subunit PstC [Aggregatilinea sp.]HML20726.1 phosphate ABC transporter permease subunit PstC [Aggregatilinea sp.]